MIPGSPTRTSEPAPANTSVNATVSRGETVYGWYFIVGGLLSLVIAIVSTRPAIAIFSFLQALFWFATGYTILRNSKIAVRLVWVGIVLGGLGAVARGLSPLEIFLWLITLGLGIWYTNRRQKIAQSAVGSVASQQTPTRLWADTRRSFEQPDNVQENRTSSFTAAAPQVATAQPAVPNEKTSASALAAQHNLQTLPKYKHNPKAVDNLLNSYDHRRLTPDHLALGNKITAWLNQTLEKAQTGGLIGEAPRSLRMSGKSKLTANGLESLADHLAESTANPFSSAKFIEYFKGKPLKEGWTLSDALAVWYSLGHLALVIATWKAYNDRAKVALLLDHTRPKLVKKWGFSPELFEKLRVQVNETEAAAISSFVRCKSGSDLLLFFNRYVSRILGTPVPFSERSGFEDDLLGIAYQGQDPILIATVCDLFVDVCASVKQQLDESKDAFDALMPLRTETKSEPQAAERQPIALSFSGSLADPPTDPLTIQLREQAENMDPIPGPKTVGSENYTQILDAFTKRGWVGFEETFDRIVPRSRADYVKVKRDLLREPVFSLKAQRNMLRLATTFLGGSTPAEKRAALEQELKKIAAEKAALNPPVNVLERTNSTGGMQTGRAVSKPSSANGPESATTVQPGTLTRASQVLALAQFEYHPRRRNVPGYVLIDDRTRKVLKSILSDDEPGVAFAPGQVPSILDSLQVMEEDLRPCSEAAADKVAQLRQMVTTALHEHPHGGVAFSIDDPSVRAEMQVYVTQREIGGGRVLQHANLGTLSNEPELEGFTSRMERIGYNPNQRQLLALHAATLIMVGNVDSVGGTAEQRDSFLDKYFTSVAERHGSEVLDRFEELVVHQALPILKRVSERLQKQTGSQQDLREENLNAPNSNLTRQLSSQELDRVANQLIADGRMPPREQYMQIRQKVTARWRGSKLVFGVICGGAGIDTLVFIPAERATELAAIHFAIAKAKTWRQFAEMIPAHVWSKLLHDLEDNESTPDLDSKFDPGMIGIEDGDWPDWPEQEMMEWLPPEAVASYATVHQSVINGPFLSIDPTRLADVIEALESAGHTCHRDDPLVKQACGREDWSDEGD